MNYRIIDLDTLPRKEHFMHFTKEVNCSCCMTANVDVTELRCAAKKENIRFYIAFLYCICKVLNAHEEFRMGYYWQKEMLILWDEIWPSHIVFHPENETFTRIVSAWNPDFESFYQTCAADIEHGKLLSGYSVPDVPMNIFDASCIPWVNYQAMNLVVPKDWIYLAPIITWGKYVENGEKMLLPLTMQIHHAVADGFHISRFFHEVEMECKTLAEIIQTSETVDFKNK